MPQEKAGDKLSEASDKVYLVHRAFAAQHNVTLTEGQTSKLSRKLVLANKVQSYMNKMFLINFKSSVQESNMITALNKKDINAFEQSRNAMKGYAEEGMARLDTVSKFKDDASVLNNLPQGI